MDLEIVGRHVEVTEPMERQIRGELDKLPQYARMLQYVTVTLDVDSGGQLVETVAKYPRADLVVEARGHDMYKCIDEAFAKLERRLKRHHDKLVNGRAREAQKAAESDRQPE